MNPGILKLANLLELQSVHLGDHQYVAPGVSLSSTRRPSSPNDPSRASLLVNPDAAGFPVTSWCSIILLALQVFFSRFS